MPQPLAWPCPMASPCAAHAATLTLPRGRSSASSMAPLRGLAGPSAGRMCCHGPSSVANVAPYLAGSQQRHLPHMHRSCSAPGIASQGRRSNRPVSRARLVAGTLLHASFPSPQAPFGLARLTLQRPEHFQIMKWQRGVDTAVALMNELRFDASASVEGDRHVVGPDHAVCFMASIVRYVNLRMTSRVVAGREALHDRLGRGLDGHA
jgi:hypothetical protein